MSRWFFVFIDEVAFLAEQAREGGAVSAPEKEGKEPGPLLRKLLDRVKGSEKGNKEGYPVHNVVNLMENLPPLPRKLVELIWRGSFMEFATFLML